MILARLITSIIKGAPYKPTSMFIALDSECIISTLEAQDRVLEMWFSNWVAEVNDHLDSWERQGIKVYQVHLWPGTDNLANLGMKGKATLADIRPGSR